MIKNEIITKSKYLEFKACEFLDDKKWYYVKRTNDSPKHDSAVVITTIVRINHSYSFLLLKTKRPAMIAEHKSEYCLECPAGLIADDNSSETLIECINKELLEETGRKADRIYIELSNSCTSAGLTSETLSYATAICNTDTIIQEPLSDGGIIIDRIFVPVDNIFEFISQSKTKYSIASSALSGLFFAADRLKNISTFENVF